MLITQDLSCIIKNSFISKFEKILSVSWRHIGISRLSFSTPTWEKDEKLKERHPSGCSNASILMPLPLFYNRRLCEKPSHTETVCKNELWLHIISVTLGYKDCRSGCIHYGNKQQLPIVHAFSPLQQKALSPFTNFQSACIQLCCAFHWQLFNNISSNSMTWKCNSASLVVSFQIGANPFSVLSMWRLLLLRTEGHCRHSYERTAYAK